MRLCIHLMYSYLVDISLADLTNGVVPHLPHRHLDCQINQPVAHSGRIHAHRWTQSITRQINCQLEMPLQDTFSELPVVFDVSHTLWRMFKESVPRTEQSLSPESQHIHLDY